MSKSENKLGTCFKTHYSQFNKLFPCWVGLGVGVLLLQACSNPQKSHSSTKKLAGIAHPSVRSESGSSHTEENSFHDIESLCTKNLLDSCEVKINSFLHRYPQSHYLPFVENWYGLLLLQKKKPDTAIFRFQKAIHLNPSNTAFNQYILFNIATAQFDSNLIEDSLQSLSQIQLSQLDKSTRLKFHFLKANLAQKQKHPLESSRQLLTAGRLLSENESADTKKVIYHSLDQSLSSIADIEILDQLYKEFEDSLPSDAVLFRQGSQEIAAGNRSAGEFHLKSLIQKYPSSPYYPEANQLISTQKTQYPVESHSIGILLPTQGKFSKYGLKSLQGIQLAFKAGDAHLPPSQVNLVIEDSGEDPAQAIQALDRLVTQKHVVAVIGPMLSKGVDQISQRAQELGVPLLSLSRRAGSSFQDYVFQAGLTQQIQAYEIARYAIQTLGIKRFAILHPNEKFGNDLGQSFWDAVESLGGKITGIESYNPEETDFRQTVDRLSGLYYTEARHRELELLAKEREANQITKRSRKTEQFYRLKPIVDYEAVFIADEPKVAGQILPTFAYRDIETIKFLGTSSWNTAEFISRAQAYAEHSLFVDAYFSDSSQPLVKNFSERFKKAYGQDPGPFEALAFDAATLLQSILTTSGDHLSRDDLRNRLMQVKEVPGITGKLTYRQGQLYRDLQVITVQKGKFVEATTPTP